MAHPEARGSIRADLIVLAIAATLLFTLSLGARDLWNPNEPTYGQAVAEMARDGSWLVPTVNGQPFHEKPILYFWLARGAGTVLGGVSEWTLRLPSALSGIASVLLLYLLVEPYAGRRRARIAAALLSTTYIVFWSSRSVQMDLMLACCTLGAILAVTRVIDHGLAPWRGWTLGGIASGLGFLAKGPVGLICPGMVLAAYIIARRRLRDLLRPAVLLGAAAFLLTAGPWYLLLWARGEVDFLTELIYRQNFLRFTEPWDHQAPWWYFLKHFWLDMLPWALFLPLAFGLTPEGPNERRLHRLVWIWIVLPIVFFSASASKRSPYILPVAPAVAVLAAALGERWLEGRLGRWRTVAARLLLAALGLLLLTGAYALTFGLVRIPTEALESASRATAALLLAGGIAVLAGIRWRRGFAAASALFGFVVAIYLLAATFVLPAFDAVKSHRPLCEAVNGHVAADQPLYGYRLWRWRASYSYYSGRKIRSLDSAEELWEYWNRPEQVFLIVERGMLDEARTVVGNSRPLIARAVGDNFIYLFTNGRTNLND